MQKYPLTILAKASELLGISKSELKKQLKSGSISGEKLVVDGKTKWFVHAQEMENLLNQIIEFSDDFEIQRQNVEGFDNVFESSSVTNKALETGKKAFIQSNANLKNLVNEWQVHFVSLKQLTFDLSDRLEKLEHIQHQCQEEIGLLKFKNSLLEREVNLLVNQSKGQALGKKTWFAKLKEIFKLG